MKSFLLLFSLFVLTCFESFAQTENLNADILGAFPVSFNVYEETKNAAGEEEEEKEVSLEINLSDYLETEVMEAGEFLENSGNTEGFENERFEMVLADVLGYRELPSYTVDGFDVKPVFYEYGGSVDVGIEEDEDLLSLTNKAFDVSSLEDRAVYSLIAPPCGSPSAAIYCDKTITIPQNTCIYDFPIKNNQPYLIQFRFNNDIHLLRDTEFGVNMGELKRSNRVKYRGNVRKNRGYESVSIEFDAFELEPVTVKVYDKWGETIEIHESHTSKVLELDISDYWWGVYWVSVYFQGDDCLLFKQLCLEK